MYDRLPFTQMESIKVACPIHRTTLYAKADNALDGYPSVCLAHVGFKRG